MGDSSYGEDIERIMSWMFTIAMPEKLATPTAPRDVYQPLSGFAVASAMLGGFFALLVVVLGALAFYYGTPLLLPSWSLLIPLLAAGLGLAALRQIKLSEGTRTGKGLANGGLALSLIIGLGYYVGYYLPTYLAVRLQAEAAAEKFFDKLRNGQINAAFLLTRAPDQRDTNPLDEQRMMIRFGVGEGGRPGPLLLFRNLEIIRILSHAGSDLDIIPLGVREWDVVQDSFHFKLAYRFKTPEGTFDYDFFLVRRVHGKEWTIRPENDFASTPQWTDLGNTVNRWRTDARQFVSNWLDARLGGDTLGLYAATLPFNIRNSTLARYRATIVADQVAAAGMAFVRAPVFAPVSYFPVPDSDWQRRRYLPGYADFVDGNLIETHSLQTAGDNAFREKVVRRIKTMFQVGSQVQVQLAPEKANIDPIGETFTSRHIINLLEFRPDVKIQVPEFECRAELEIVSDAPLKEGARPFWRIKRIRLLSAVQPELTGNAPPP
ncbi:MAG: hypothetical protein KatS3mg105_1820 [Gemmatales bacterium]|nr:MAG: hypothetical protein KatS3mg105_1820 [Gemmatales bacterium]